MALNRGGAFPGRFSNFERQATAICPSKGEEDFLNSNRLITCNPVQPLIPLITVQTPPATSVDSNLHVAEFDIVVLSLYHGALVEVQTGVEKSLRGVAASPN